MKDKRCLVCKNQGHVTHGSYIDQVYDKKGNSSSIHLCWGHSVEFFKTGQYKFIAKYESTSNIKQDDYSGLINDFQRPTFR